VFESRVLRRIFGPKKDEVTGEWRTLHDEELYNPYSSPNIFWVIKSRMGWGGTCSTCGGEERRIWEDNIKMDLQEVEYGGMD